MSQQTLHPRASVYLRGREGPWLPLSGCIAEAHQTSRLLSGRLRVRGPGAVQSLKELPALAGSRGLGLLSKPSLQDTSHDNSSSEVCIRGTVKRLTTTWGLTSPAAEGTGNEWSVSQSLSVEEVIELTERNVGLEWGCEALEIGEGVRENSDETRAPESAGGITHALQRGSGGALQGRRRLFLISRNTLVLPAAGAIAKCLRATGGVEIACVGPNNINTAIKAMATSRKMLAEEGLDLCVFPYARSWHSDMSQLAVRFSLQRSSVHDLGMFKRHLYVWNRSSRNDPGILTSSIYKMIKNRKHIILKVTGKTTLALALVGLLAAQQETLDRKSKRFVFAPEFETDMDPSGSVHLNLYLWWVDDAPLPRGPRAQP